MKKTKRRIKGSLQRELWNMFYKIRPNDLLVQYQKYINVICNLFKINNIPELKWCDSPRQGECIRLNNGVNPCGGGCYTIRENNKGIIYLRDHYINQDLLLHELFHHINRLNSEIQENIMHNAIQYKDILHKTDFLKTIKDLLKNK